MASPKFCSFVALISLLFVYAYCSYIEDRSINVPSGIESIVAPTNDQKVNLSIYYDYLNPQVALFIVKDLKGVLDNDLITILNLRMVHWNEADTNNSNKPIFYQNDTEGCDLNTIQACAIDIWRVVDKHFGFIYCIELLVIEGKQKDWQSCFSTYGLPPKPILDCYNSGNGTKLEHKYGNETMHLSPPLKLVPWVVLNDNQPIGKDYDNFTVYVCTIEDKDNTNTFKL